jgi:hypothetical protein
MLWFVRRRWLLEQLLTTNACPRSIDLIIHYWTFGVQPSWREFFVDHTIGSIWGGQYGRKTRQRMDWNQNHTPELMKTGLKVSNIDMLLCIMMIPCWCHRGSQQGQWNAICQHVVCPSILTVPLSVVMDSHEMPFVKRWSFRQSWNEFSNAYSQNKSAEMPLVQKESSIPHVLLKHHWSRKEFTEGVLKCHLP